MYHTNRMGEKITVLLTGASGHIGSRWLAEHSPKVGKIIALSTSGAPMPPTPSGVSVEVRKGTIPEVDPKSLLDGVDVVVHLAAKTPASDVTDAKYDEINCRWVERLGSACMARGTHLFFPSTSAIYAAKQGELLVEDTERIKPQNPYAESKLKAEEALRNLAKDGLEVVIARFGSVFGHSRKPHFKTRIDAFVKDAVEGRPLSVWKNTLEQMRGYTYVGDCAKVINFCVENDLFDGEVYNVVSENATTASILDSIRAVVPNLEIELTEPESAVNYSFGMDGTKMAKKGFEPSGTIREGVTEMVAKLRG